MLTIVDGAFMHVDLLFQLMQMLNRMVKTNRFLYMRYVILKYLHLTLTPTPTITNLTRTLLYPKKKSQKPEIKASLGFKGIVDNVASPAKY